MIAIPLERTEPAWAFTGYKDSLVSAFLARTLPTVNGCWAWTEKLHATGYAYVGNTPAHRVSYRLFIGPIPDGLQIDHLCRVRNCINPEHLEPVTRQINLLRGETLPAHNAAKTHCPRGHAYDEANTARYRNRRYCRACQRDRNAARTSAQDVA